MKRIFIRFANGFCFSIAMTLVIQVVVMVLTGDTPMLPEYMARFDNQLIAFATQLLLIGVMSGITSMGTAVFEAKRIGLPVQSLLFLVIMLSAWIPVACFAWGFHKYMTSMIITTCSIVVTYGICWGIVYRIERKDIADINAKLLERKGNKH